MKNVAGISLAHETFCTGLTGLFANLVSTEEKFQYFSLN